MITAEDIRKAKAFMFPGVDGIADDAPWVERIAAFRAIARKEEREKLLDEIKEFCERVDS